MFATLAWFVIGALGCAPLRVPPLTSSPTDQIHLGKFVWHDLLTDDVSAAKDFYGGVFGWTFETNERYTVVSNNGTPIAGFLEVAASSGDKANARWLGNLSLQSVDDAAARLEDAGGAVHEGPRDLPKRGRFALVSDPQGAELVLLRSASGDPPDGEAEQGAWLWNELWSKDAQHALAFYQELVGYESAVAPGLSDYWILTRDGRWRAGVRSLPFRETVAEWVPVVRVLDPVAVSADVVSFGGRVLIRPGEPPSDGSVALIADPGGAILMIQQWPGSSAEAKP